MAGLAAHAGFPSGTAGTGAYHRMDGYWMLLSGSYVLSDATPTGVDEN